MSTRVMALHQPLRTTIVTMKSISKRGLVNVAPYRRQMVAAMAQSTKIADMSLISKKEKKEKKKEEEDEIEENGQSLSPQQVEMFLNVLCEETDIAEVELKMSGFKMKVRRSLDNLGSSSPSASVAAPVAAPIQAAPTTAPEFATSAAVETADVDSDVENDDDGSVIAVRAPKVGVLRRGRYVKGKQVGKAPAAEEGSTVKSGQPLCYIEQLGTFWPVESPQAGEIVGFLVEEGEAVEYREDIVEIAPFFGGHIIGDSKHA